MENAISKIYSDKMSGIATPILWAFVALAYMFEIGAVAVLINADEVLWLQYSAAIGALVMPLVGIGMILYIRCRKEELLYPSQKRLDEMRGTRWDEYPLSSESENNHE